MAVEYITLDPGNRHNLLSTRASIVDLEEGIQKVTLAVNPNLNEDGSVKSKKSNEQIYQTHKNLNSLLSEINIDPSQIVAETYFADHNKLKPEQILECRKNIIEGEMPTHCFTGQVPANPNQHIALEAIAYAGTNISQETYNGFTANIIHFKNLDLVYMLGITGKKDNKYGDLASQCFNIFDNANNFLKQLRGNFKDHALRTWIYVDNIDKNYATFNEKGRDIFFEQEEIKYYFPSTGIGTKSPYPNVFVFMDVLAVIPHSQSAINGLELTTDRMPPPKQYDKKFVRGKDYSPLDIIISGTASINKNGISIHQGDSVKQLRRTLGNIQGLTGTLDGITRSRIYLRNKSDFKKITNELRGLGIPIQPIIVKGHICRPEWLVEIEMDLHNPDFA